MVLGKKIKVLVVDDSIFFREILARGIASDPGIEVVGKAVDPFDARDKILELYPEVMICDVQMPKMNGIEFIRRLLPQYPLPVIVVSTVSEAVFDAMDAGAVDFVAKPEVQSPKSIEDFLNELIAKIKIAAAAKVNRVVTSNTGRLAVPRSLNTERIIAIGSSTGGTEALYSILRQLPPSVPGIVIVQHIPPLFSRMFAERLDKQILLKVKEAQNGDFLEPGSVLIAPGDRHMKIRRLGDRYKAEIFFEEKVNGHCPSADVLFESVAKQAGSNSIGIILTGMGYDGAKGLLSMRRKGARTIGQDEQSSVVYGMPKAAYEIGAVERQAALESIPQVLLSMLSK